MFIARVYHKPGFMTADAAKEITKELKKRSHGKEANIFFIEAGRYDTISHDCVVQMDIVDDDDPAITGHNL